MIDVNGSPTTVGTGALEKPHLRPIKNGWAASGRGWAVHGATREEATERFYEAERIHRKIEVRPFWGEWLQSLIVDEKVSGEVSC